VELAIVGGERALSRAEAESRRARQAWRTSVWLGRLALLVCVLLLWQLLSGRLLDVTFLSRPTEIAQAWLKLAGNGLLLDNLQTTLAEFVIGFAAGALIAFAAACVLTLRPVAYRLLEPYVLALYGIPKVALAPLFVLWFGIDLLPKVVLVGMITFFLVFMNTVAGIRSVNPQMLDLMRVMGASRLDLYRQVILPQALPFALTALRISIPSAMVGAVLGEFLAAGGGIGYLIYQAGNYLDTAQMLALIGTLAVIVLVFRLLLLPLERWVGRFQRSATGGEMK
jgi:NitT/TauT family transport system permease protein